MHTHTHTHTHAHAHTHPHPHPPTHVKTCFTDPHRQPSGWPTISQPLLAGESGFYLLQNETLQPNINEYEITGVCSTFVYTHIPYPCSTYLKEPLSFWSIQSSFGEILLFGGQKVVLRIPGGKKKPTDISIKLQDGSIYLSQTGPPLYLLKACFFFLKLNSCF